MEPRLCDNRVGYFNLTVTDYAGDDQRMASNERCFITRYRLEKKDPNAAISDPVKPIVYYLDANTPMKWRPYLKKAIEDWQPAFEAAGFSHAIIAKDAPTNDPDWSPEDARYSVVRWLPSTTENASGPNIHDPRSGEILNAHIQFYHNVQNLARTWYFTQAAANDPRARQFPLPDSLMGRLLEYVLAHEVGHTIGFQHNMKASSQYPLDTIRNVDFLRRMGHVSTLMDYSRFNYVVQPEDHIAARIADPANRSVRHVGNALGLRADHTPMQVAQQGSARNGAELLKAAEAKRATLDAWAREQDTKPWLRFSTSGAFGSDPGDETEAVGDADPVRATELGIRNLKRNMQWIETATVHPNDDYDVIAELYGREVSQFRTEMGHVANLVGGMNSQEKYGDQPGVRFTPVPKAKQKEAMKFIAEQGVPDADVADRYGHAPQDRAERRSHAHRRHAVVAHHGAAAGRKDDAPHRVGSAREEPVRRLHTHRHAGRSAPRRVHRIVRQRPGEGRCVSPRPSGVESGAASHSRTCVSSAGQSVRMRRLPSSSRIR